MKNIHLTICLGLLLACGTMTAVAAESSVRLPRFISSGMVLQRGDTARIWGWSDAGAEVRVQFLKKRYVTRADSEGRWQVSIPTTRLRQGGGPYTMLVNELQLDDIYVGDVWLCSGQSNMDLHCARLEDLYKTEFDADSIPAIHLMQTARRPQVVGPQDDVPGEGFVGWQSLKPANVGHWSGIGYFFAKEMYARTGVPQGIINASMGGSDIVAWCSEELLSAEAPKYINELEYLRTPGYLDRNQQFNQTISRAYNNIYEENDPGLSGRWMDPDFDDATWEVVNQYDDNIGEEHGRTWRGSLWFRKEFFVPDSLVGRDSLLRLGCLNHSDVCYLNGEKVGETGYEYPPRKYAVRPGLLCAGRNVLCIRLKTHGVRQKFVPDKPYRMLFHGGAYIDLEGDYRMHRGVLMAAQPSAPGVYNGIGASLYNNTIHPLLPYRVAGILWYQGETNAGRPAEYRQLLPAMITDWRRSFGQVPVVVFGLANYMQRHTNPEYDGGWAKLRESQRLAVNSLDKAALVTLIDLGEWNDIHPLNKKEAARRAALQMRRLMGERQLITEGPVVDTVRFESGRVIVTFRLADGDSLCIRPAHDEHTSSGIVHVEATLQGFRLIGSNQKAAWATAQIQQAGSTKGAHTQDVVLTSPDVPEAILVQYGWNDDPLATLYGSTGLPAAPFQYVCRRK